MSLLLVGISIFKYRNGHNGVNASDGIGLIYDIGPFHIILATGKGVKKGLIG